MTQFWWEAMARRLLSQPLTYLALSGFLLCDQPRRDVPADWNTSLYSKDWGRLIVKQEGDVEMRYVTAQIGKAPLEIVPVSWFAQNRPDTAPVGQFVERFRSETRRPVLAAINGGFFDLKTRLPIGFLLRNGEMDFFNMPQGIRRSMVGFTAPRTGAPGVLMASPSEMPRVWLDVADLREGGRQRSLPIHHINVPGGKHAFSIFTPRYGRELINHPDAVYLLAQRAHPQSTWLSVQPATGKRNISIPSDGVVIALFGDSRRLLGQLGLGTRVRPRWTLPPAWQNGNVVHGLLAGPRLLEKGKLRVSAQEEKLAHLKSRDRVAMGVTENGEVIMLWAHRKTQGTSLGFEETAQLMADLGAVEAIALDGGSSRSLWANARQPYREEEYSFQGRSVANALLVTVRDPA